MPARPRAKTRFSPRKEPTQERARVTVEAILRATARILVKHGYEGMTTNHVAKLAGVSVGSLYQYFPSKEALVRELVQRHLEQVNRAMTPDPALLGQPLEVLARAMVKGIFDAHAIDPTLHKELLMASPRVGIPERNLLVDNGERLVKLVLEAYADRLPKLDVERTAVIIVAAVDGIMLNVSRDHGAWFDDPALLDDVVRLLLGFVGQTPSTKR